MERNDRTYGMKEQGAFVEPSESELRNLEEESEQALRETEAGSEAQVLNTDSMKLYLKEISRYPLLTPKRSMPSESASWTRKRAGKKPGRS